MSLLKLFEGAAPATPGTGEMLLYAKTDKRFYQKDDTGLETVFALGGVVGSANTVYVAADGGDDGSGTRGDPALPFQTVKAGLAACQDGDVLRIAAGVYSMGVGQTPVWPAGVNNLVIIGEGNHGIVGVNDGGTHLRNVANDGSHIFAPPNTADSIHIMNLSASVSAGGGIPMYFDGTGGAGSFLGGGALGTGGLYLNNVCAHHEAGNTAFWARHVGIGLVRNSSIGQLGGTSSTITSNLQFYDVRADSMSIEWDATDPDAPTLGRLGTELVLVSLGTVLSVGKQGSVSINYSNIDLLQGNGLSQAGGLSPEITATNSVVRDIDFNTPGRQFPDVTGPDPTLHFYNCGLQQGNFRCGTAPVTNRLRVTFSGVQVDSGGVFQVNDGIDLNAFGLSGYKLTATGFSTSNGGTVLLPVVAREYTTVDPSPDAGVTYGSASVDFYTTPRAVVVTPSTTNVGIVAVGNFSNTTLDLSYTGSGGTAVYIVSMWEGS